MKRFIPILFVILLATLITPALAQTSSQQVGESIVLTGGQGNYPLGLDLQILEDPTGKLTIQDITSDQYSSQFRPSNVSVPNYGFTQSAYWVSFTLDNQTQQITDWLLEVGFANMHYVDLYSPLPDDMGFSGKQTGVLRPVASRDLVYPLIIFKLPVPSQSVETFYLRFQNGGSMTLPLTLWAPSAFINQSTMKQVLDGIFYGILIGLLFYNLFLLFTLREGSYAFFVILLASLIIEEATYDGYLEIYIIPNLYFLIDHIYPLTFFLLFTFMISFADSFLQLKHRLPKFHWVDLGIISVGIVCMILSLLIDYHVMALLGVPWAIASLIVVAIAGIISWLRGFRPVRLFMIAWLGLLLSMVWVLLVRLQFASSNVISENAYRIGYLWMAICWSIALADRINLLKVEKENAFNESQATESRYRQLVETMNDGLAVTDQEARYTYVNQRMCTMLGYQAEELIGHKAFEFMDKVNEVILTEQLQARRSGASSAYELKMLRKDGSDLYLSISPMPLFENDHRYKGSVVVATDITERVLSGHLLEQRVNDRTKKLSTLLELSHELSTSKGLDNQLHEILKRLKTVVDFNYAVIVLAERGFWKIKVCSPATIIRESDDLVLSVEEELALTTALKSGKPVITNALTSMVAELSVVNKIYTWLEQSCTQGSLSSSWIPIVLKENLIGLFIVGCASESDFTDESISIASTFANQAAIVIENDQLFTKAQASAAADERNRLAQELHDSVTQTLFTASILAQATPRIWKRDVSLAQQNMEKLNTLLRGALAEMRSLFIELRSGELQNQTLGKLLTMLVEAGRTRTLATITLTINRDHFLPGKVITPIYRIAQEALNNAINHSNASQIEINMDSSGELLELHIQDDGCGFIPEEIPAGHLGLNIMQERAAQIQAGLHIQSEPGIGTVIAIRWPEKGEYSENE